ncbi:MAG: class I SAM-dependent methyltransferase [Desulfobulbaceae bacterium]|nr:class I SAM-dependent methyltransferase [Desulfobulbaceae bacterium]
MIDLIMSPFTYIAAKYLGFVRMKGFERMPVSRFIFRKVGVVPVTNHYYEPLPNVLELKSLDIPELNPSITMNMHSILDYIRDLKYKDEISQIDFESLLNDARPERFQFFLPQEAELYYLMIRNLKPQTVLEVGSGFSSKVAHIAIQKNKEEQSNYSGKLICIEPYENEWLEKMGIEVIREKIENCNPTLFYELNANDILFIDSSHQIKPEGDVLYEYHRVIPALNSGVYVQIHDIFYPRNYPQKWLVDAHSFWNEQYLLESFLMFNEKYEILLPQNHLMRDYSQDMLKLLTTPNLYSEFNQSACSFWFKRK